MAARAAGPSASTGRDAVIVDALRTPIGRSHPERGWFRDVHPNAMLGAVYTALLDGAGLGPEVIEDLIVGCTAPFAEQSRNIARNPWLQAGYPPEVPATVLDRRCGSAQTAVKMAAALVRSGTHDLVIAGGAEHMGHVPMNSPVKISELYGDPWPPELRERYDFVPQGESAELIADRWHISRQEMDEYAVRSHRLIEVNEAFSSVVLAWERELEPDMDRVNVNGGAIALGHPVGATGGRLFATLLAEMERPDAETGLVAMCCGGGLGTATIVQRLG
jgi:acetyl-CoA acetyltransferase